MPILRTANAAIRLACLCALICGAYGAAPAWSAENGSGSDAFEQGSRALAAGRYGEALAWYEKAEQEHGISAALLYNRGNACYHAKDIGNCILSYERALLLEPGNADIRANLALARQDFGLYDPPAPWWRTAAGLMSLNGWSVLANAALTALGLLVFLRGIAFVAGRRAAGPAGPFAAAALCCAVLFLAASGGLALGLRDARRAVVMGHDARLLVSPFDTAAQSGPLREGRTVTVQKTHGAYAFIQDAAGNSGWVETSALTPLVPPGEKG